MSPEGAASESKGSDDREPTDAYLVRRFQAGDTDAFTSLMRRHERSVYNLAFRMLGRTEDARDATQDAFLSCYRHLSTFRGDAAFSTWLHRIAVNACYDTLRKRPAVTSIEEEVPDPATVADPSDRSAEAADVQRALLEVPPEYRAVLILHEIQDQPVEAVAAALDIPVGTVKSRLHRARVALGRALAGNPAASVPRPTPRSHD